MNVYEEYLDQIVKPLFTNIMNRMDSLNRTIEWVKRDIKTDSDIHKYQEQLDCVFFKAWEEIYKLSNVNYFKFADEKLESKFKLNFYKDSLTYDFDIQISGLILSMTEQMMRDYVKTSRYLIDITSPRVLDLNSLRKGSFDIDPREVFDPRKLFRGTNMMLIKDEKTIYQSLRDQFITILYCPTCLGNCALTAKTNIDKYSLTIWYQQCIGSEFHFMIKEIVSLNKKDYIERVKWQIDEKELMKCYNNEEIDLSLYTFEMDIKNLIVTILEWAIEQYITGSRFIITSKFDFREN